jgi:hypothetical protein
MESPKGVAPCTACPFAVPLPIRENSPVHVMESAPLPVEIATARSVRRALANVGSRSVAENFFRRSTCMWSSRFLAS